MSTQMIRAVIGKNFGDEGKGLAVDYFCSRAPGALVVKHNGGAQAGHTVEQGGRRFVFHQLSAGSFRRSDTLWARTYYPDLYKLREEEEEFAAVAGFRPTVLSDAATPVTLIDDVLINMFLETQRGAARHGSCGMGIYEATLRTRAGFGLTVSDFLSENAASLTARILRFREEYVRGRIAEALAGVKVEPEDRAEAAALVRGSETEATGAGSEMPEASCGAADRRDVLRGSSGNDADEILRCGLPGSEYLELLQSRQIVENYVDEMLRNAAKYVTVAENVGALLRSRENVVFESGQGLLLDEGNRRFAPHISASKTGLANPVMLLAEHGLALTEAVYVTRTYVTRHGAGDLPYECTREALGIESEDATNVENPWQGKIRYAPHGTVEEFLAPVRKDVRCCGGGRERTARGNEPEGMQTSLFVTHLDETNRRVLLADGATEIEAFREERAVREVFRSAYWAFGRGADDVVCP